MLLIIAFALFLFIIAAWVVAPAASTARRAEPAVPTALTAVGSQAG